MAVHLPGTEVRVPVGATLGSSEDRFVNRFINPFLLPWPVTLLPASRGGEEWAEPFELGF